MKRKKMFASFARDAVILPIGLAGIVLEEGPQLLAGLAMVAAGQARRLTKPLFLTSVFQSARERMNKLAEDWIHGDTVAGLMLEDLAERLEGLSSLDSVRHFATAQLGRLQDRFRHLEKRAGEGRYRGPINAR